MTDLQHIQELLDTIKFNAEISAGKALDLLNYKIDMYVTDRAATIESRCNDNVRLVAALESLIKTITTNP